jgi:hypothetical protein
MKIKNEFNFHLLFNLTEKMEVFRITPEVGKCYYTVEATESQYLGNGNFKYFTTNSYIFCGKYLRTERYGFGDGQEVVSIFEKDGKEFRVEYSYEGFTCFKLADDVSV